MVNHSRSTWQFGGLIAILLLGLALRVALWGQNRFLEDEALYAYWGLQIASGADPMLDEEPVDKPPLHPYLLALSFLLSAPPSASGVSGGHETAARLPSLLASMASIGLVYALGVALYDDRRVGLLAALLVALSPFDLLFASTAFTDPLMTALVLGALLAAAVDRPGAAGLLIGLAVATKQQGVFFLPLVVAVGILTPRPTQVASQNPGRREGSWAGRALGWLKRLWAQRWLRFSLGFGSIVAGVLWWDTARLQRPGFLEQSFISYGGLGPAQPGSLAERAVEWLHLAGAFWSPWLIALLSLALACWLVGGLKGWWLGWNKLDLALALYLVAYLLLHWLVGFQVWDRYLLGLVPLVALLAARALVVLGAAIPSTWGQRVYVVAVSLLLVASLSGPVVRAVRSELPVGGDHGAYDGIDHLATYMRTQAPPGSVLYHYWLGYHYRFYLYDAAQRLHWYPDLEDLARDAHVYRREPRYIALPSFRDTAPVEAALAEAGIRLEPVYETVRRDGSVSFRLYRLEGPEG
ncbi:MAG: glycosyltransferase family 39 protein [Anaerolineae bacterium]|jgi:4-amino-4-deoxy-L-arabinose transferase-like glycosyltransferase